jgi:hypothetical protein
VRLRHIENRRAMRALLGVHTKRGFGAASRFGTKAD